MMQHFFLLQESGGKKLKEVLKVRVTAAFGRLATRKLKGNTVLAESTMICCDPPSKSNPCFSHLKSFLCSYIKGPIRFFLKNKKTKQKPVSLSCQ